MKFIKLLVCAIVTFILLDVSSASAQTNTVSANTIQANKQILLSGNKADSITNDGNFTTNSATHLVTQHAIKAYVDSKVLNSDTTFIIYGDNTGLSRLLYGTHDSLVVKTIQGSGGIVVSTVDSFHILINCVSCGAGSSAPTNSGSGQRLYHLGSNTISTLVFPANSYLKADSTTNIGSITIVVDTTTGKAATKTDIANVLFGIHGTVGQFTYLTAQGQVYTTGVVMDSVFNQYTFPRKLNIFYTGISQNAANTGFTAWNNSAATATNAQYGPELWSIGGWYNSGTTTSQQLGFGIYTKPTAGTASPTGTLHIEWEWNGNSAISVGDITNNGGLIFANGTLGTLYAGVTPVSNNGASIYVGGTGSTQGLGALKFKDVSLVTTPESGLIEYKNGLLMMTDSLSGTDTRDTVAGRAWVRSIGGGGGAPGGSSNQIQVNLAGAFTGYSTFTYNGTTFAVTGSSGTDMVDFTGTGASRNGIHLQETNSAGDAEYYIENDRGSFNSYGVIEYGGSANGGSFLGLDKADRLFIGAAGTNNVGMVIGTAGPAPISFSVNGSEAARMFSTGHLVIGPSPSDDGAWLEVPLANSTTPQFMFAQSTVDVTSGLNDGMVWYNHTAHTLNFRDNSTTFNLLATASPTGVRFRAPGGLLPSESLNDNESIGANKIHVIRFYLPYTILVNNLRVNVTTPVGGSTVQMGIYDNNGNKVAATAAISSAANGLATGSVSGPITLVPGFYWAAYVSSSAGVTVEGYNNTANVEWDTTIIGEATNVVSGGIMPATLGTITSNDNSLTNNAAVITILH